VKVEIEHTRSKEHGQLNRTACGGARLSGNFWMSAKATLASR
jgi:hypothetical protein